MSETMHDEPRLAERESPDDRPPSDEADEAAAGAFPEPTVRERFKEAFPRATRWLQGAPPASPGEALRELAAEAEAQDDPDQWDRYGERGPVAALEAAVAELLNKPAVAMFPSGIMAQQSVLRVWSDRKACTRIAIPELSHLLKYEADGPRVLNGFRYEHLTTGPSVPLKAHLDAIPGKLGAALLELPLRDAGYLLPTWDELVDFSTAARARDVPLHLDGARLWESQPYLGHSLAEIADVADSVYVSFYKGLGGLAGAAVAGPTDVVDEARQWRRRHGGTLFSLTPYALAGLRGLRERLPAMASWHARAVELAAAFQEIGLRIWPQPPHTNSFRIFIDQPEDVVNERIVRAMEEDRAAVLWPVQAGEQPGTSWTEFTVGAATFDWEVADAADAIARLLG